MESTQGADRIAVMIDADNTRPAYADAVLSEVAKYGNPTIRRVYGDWANPHLTQWSRKLNRLGLRAMHQAAWTSGKNSTDLALVIDAMDLLYDGNVEAFALVTSDSDFTSLAHRLRESGKAVYVLGENKAPESLRNACDKFIDLANVGETSDDDPDDEGTEASEVTPTINLQSALTRAVNAVADDEGWALLPVLGNQLIRTHPSFDARNFAGPGARLSTLVEAQPYLETSGSGNQVRVRLKGRHPQQQQSKKGAQEKADPEKPPAKKAQTKKAQTKKAQTKKAPVEKAPDQTAPEKAPVEKAPAQKARARKAPEKAPEQAPAEKAPAQTAPAQKDEPVIRTTTRTRKRSGGSTS
jgi:uncharacterized protein (TIGR00288 family)